MSYTRDRDSATRGAGAIASRDMAHPHAARARARARALATLERDRAMRGATYGRRGGVVGGLGAINAATNTPTGMTGGIRRPVLSRGGRIEEPGWQNQDPKAPTGPQLPPRNFVRSPVVVLPPKPAPPAPTRVDQVRSPTVTKGSRGSVYEPLNPVPVVIVDPVRPPKIPGTPERKPVVQVPVVSGGGAGGGGGGGSGGGSPIPDFEVDDLPDAEDVAPAAKPGMSTGAMLVIGALVGGAILLLRDDD